MFSGIGRVVLQDLAPNGRIRAGINFGNPVLAQRDPATGEPRGVAVDLARELGRQIGMGVDRGTRREVVPRALLCPRAAHTVESPDASLIRHGKLGRRSPIALHSENWQRFRRFVARTEASRPARSAWVAGPANHNQGQTRRKTQQLG
jgi:hypothetical protein